MNKKELVATFRKLGARDPEGRAQSQLGEGIAQLARYLFLRQAWGKIVKEGEPDWIEASIQRARTHPDEPYAGVGHALTKGPRMGESIDSRSEWIAGDRQRSARRDLR